MIYLIFGASCAGKSTFIKNSWFNNSAIKEEKYHLCPYTITDKVILIGKYMDGKGAYNRTVGGDRIARTFGKHLSNFILYCNSEYKDKDIVIDGFKALTKESIASILNIGIPITMLYITCSTNISIKRNEENNTTVRLSTLKACQTRARNMFNSYKNYVEKSVFVVTDDFDYEMLKKLSIHNVEQYATKEIEPQLVLF